MRNISGSTIAGRTPRRRRALSLAVLCAGCLLFAVSMAFDFRAAALTARVEPEPALPTEAVQEAMPQGLDFSKFAHTNPQHARLPCLLCHQRTDNTARPKRPGHTPCSGCHAQQFADQSSPICTICHTSPPSAALKGFPSLRTFGVRFDHATHTGAGARAANCATCHRPERRGVALSIPSGASAHTTCYQCHTPRAQGRSGQDISSCGACHRLGDYARTLENAAAYRVNFSHSAHTSKGLGCAECHTVRAGQPQRRQVTAPQPLMHHASPAARSCMTCHDDKRAFGGEDFKDCTRCHRGDAWRF
ncbi:MAG: cytochrome c3 family protein [Pyrinomonadaceae bacterium]